MTAGHVGDPVSGRDQDAADSAAPDPAMPSTATLSTTTTAGTPTIPEPTSEALARMATELGALGRRIDELARLGEHREQLLDRLHAENQRLRAGEIAQVQAPLLRGIIRSYDLVVRLAELDNAAHEDLDLVRGRLLETLDQAGVRSLDPEPESPFDASRHTAVQRVETAAAELDMTVARSVRVGFVQDGDRVLRPAEVAVHRYHPPTSTSTESED